MPRAAVGRNERHGHPTGAGAAFACWNLEKGTVVPFGPTAVDSWAVKPGTKIFVTASSFECSTIEGNGTTEAELRTCAEQSDAQTAPSVTISTGYGAGISGRPYRHWST
jgi:hypothetical protein